ncbi:hypothetical protein SAMN05216559_3567 [Halomicrobium zhouii]|uniref:Uncharacterized protein n=1 Tax=Halomicrobium zhouii TaxID=767519 RepID=A0A1I6M1X0_9EURY|nr:hypothetical protein [Halomicrobium zhouii]SFS09706.1 hypothetical protein SAMN05216559_3567 [Halomicrobium zhouii]
MALVGVLAAARLGGLLAPVEVVRLVDLVPSIRSDAATVVGIPRSRFVGLVGLLGPVLTVDPSLTFRLRDELAGLGVARRQPPALLPLGRLLLLVVVPVLVVPVLLVTASGLVVLGGVV